MLGKIIGGYIGAKTAKMEGMSQESGALIGALALPIMRRFGLPGLVAAAAGGYALKKYNARHAAPAKPKVRSSAT